MARPPPISTLFPYTTLFRSRIWLVMEYVPGRTLAQLTAQEGRLTPERGARIGAQVADGLAAAHSRGTVHRDVRSEEHTSELQSQSNLVCRLLLEKKNSHNVC